MRRMIAALLALCGLALAGCQRTGEVENQAYILVLGIDRLSDGRLALTARAPRIGGRSGDADRGSGGGDYLTFSARGDDWPSALDALERVTPRQTNLSHISMLVVSEALAAEADFAALISRVIETPHLYGTAAFTVCEGSADAFVRAGETVIGTRLSSELSAMLDHYAAQGYIPRCALADFYFAVNGIYGDPVAIHARLEASESDPPRQRFTGAALFRNGSYVGALDGRRARILNLIRGGSATLPFDIGARGVELTPEGGPRLRARLDPDGARAWIEVALSTPDDVSPEALDSIGTALEAEVSDVVSACQRLGIEPFGLAEVAASRFTTVDAWMKCRWSERFANAAVSVSVSVRRL